MLGSFVDGVESSVVIFMRLNMPHRPKRTLAMGYKRLPFEARGIHDSGLVSDCVAAMHVMLVYGAMLRLPQPLAQRVKFLLRLCLNTDVMQSRSPLTRIDAYRKV